MISGLEALSTDKTQYMENLYTLFEQYDYNPDRDHFMNASLLDTLSNIRELVDGFKIFSNQDLKAKEYKITELSNEMANLSDEVEFNSREKDMVLVQNERLQRTIDIERQQISELRKRLSELEKQEKQHMGEIRERLQRNVELEKKLVLKEKELSALRSSFNQFEQAQVLFHLIS
jgi:chromosome segregation ATPase